MAVTATPIFTQTPNVGALNAIVSTGMTSTKAYDGTEAVGTPMALCFTAGANGSRIDQIQLKFASINGATTGVTTNATVARFWLNNNSVNTTATNNIFLGEVTMPATAIASSATTANVAYTLPVPLGGLNIPANYRIYVGLTVALGLNAAIAVNAFGGDY